jgi:hypothetical protein
MYLTHHYLIDIVGGAYLATAFFHLYLPDKFKGPAALAPPPGLNSSSSGRTRNKYNLYDLEDPRLTHNGYDNRGGVMLSAREFDAVSETSPEEEVDITYSSPVPGNTTFPTSVDDSPPPSASATKKGFPKASTRGHRHTASISSLIGGEERGPEDGWSPVATSFAGTGRGRTE